MGGKMVKSEIIRQVAKKQLLLSDKDVELAVNQVLHKIVDSLCKGNRIEVRGFGSFELRYRPPRNAHNPLTGDKVVTIGKYIPHFKMGKALRDRVNNSRHLPIIEDA